MSNQKWIMGIDEAGRGPVLGPMVYGGLIWPENFDHKKTFEGYQVDDSKKITKINREKSEKLFDSLKKEKKIDFTTVVLSPQDLSHDMMKEYSDNLNSISKNAAYSMIQYFLDQGYQLSHVYIDTVGPPETYEKELENKFLHIQNLKFSVRKQADSLFPVVSAASIVAKVSRDNLLEHWEFEESAEFDKDFGCGYPGDKLTVQWLERNHDKTFGFPSIVRFSWKTFEQFHKKNGRPYKFYTSLVELEPNEFKKLDIHLRQTKCIEIDEDNLYKSFKEKAGITEFSL